MDTGALAKTPLGRTRARLVKLLNEQKRYVRDTEDWLYLQKRIDHLLEEYLRLMVTE